MASTSGTVACSRREDDVADEDDPTPVDLIGRWGYYASKLYQEEAARRACGDKAELVTLTRASSGPGGRSSELDAPDPAVHRARDLAMMPAGGLTRSTPATSRR